RELPAVLDDRTARPRALTISRHRVGLATLICMAHPFPATLCASLAAHVVACSWVTMRPAIPNLATIPGKGDPRAPCTESEVAAGVDTFVAVLGIAAAAAGIGLLASSRNCKDEFCGLAAIPGAIGTGVGLLFGIPFALSASYGF